MNQRTLITIATAIVAVGLLVGLSIWMKGTSAQRQALYEHTFSNPPTNAPVFTAQTEGLSEARAPETVELKNGATYELIASMVKKTINSQPIKMLAYNGSIPGPLIKVPQGAEITVNFTNNTDVETTIHSHGVRLENAFDGTPDLTQKPIPIGGSFTYKLKFPDAGMFWYHPHIREDYAQESGLYGNFLVVSPNADFWSPVNREVPLVIDDLLLNNGKLATFSTTTADHTLMGRFGNTMLVNGETDYQLQAKQGEVIRFYLTNTASTRTFNIAIPNAKMKLVAADSSKYERETFVESVIMSPSERATLEVLFDTAGRFTLQNKTPDTTTTLASIAVTADKVTRSYATQFSTLRTNQDIIADIDDFRSAFTKQPDKNLALTIDMTPLRQGSAGQVGMGDMMSGGSDGHGGHMMPDGSMMGGMMMGGSDGPIEWEDDMAMMNQMSTTENIQWKIIDEDTGKTNMGIDWNFKVGDQVKIKIFNDPRSMHPMQHPIHFHGQRFLVLSKNGVQNDNLAWKDTVLVGSGETIEVLVDMSNPGTWMAHCHIAEHLEDGMMLSFTIEPK